MRRRAQVLLLSATMLAGLTVSVAWAASGKITLGQIGSDTSCDTPDDFVAAQTSTSGDVSYTVPPGRWRIRSWKAAGSPTGKEALLVWRPTGAPDEYKVVAAARAHSLPNAVNEFSGIDLKVRAGDLIGFWVEAGTTCALATGNPSDAASIYFPAELPSVGTTMTLIPGYAVGYRINMKVKLIPKP